ncbi:ABC transporter substrate-binding protein [Sphingomonas sp. 2SG]|uniref:ABC transporter substrate-binding protein n=1 Tax=Sphingomonas sp. 2SG TaxID=2502201 RepID=UPI0010F76B7B|nr:ABC transporter substrate-binding protein [Sphingomonas sp. 2SG]
MRLILTTILALTLVSPGCKPPPDAAGPQDAPPIRAKKVDAVIARLPKPLRLAEPGTLTVAMTVGQLPLADFAADGTTVIGTEPDTARLIADSLGLKLHVVPVAWADWPLGLESGKYDAVLSNVTVTEERKAKFDFSTYRNDLLGIYTRSDGPVKAVNAPRDIAGLSVAVGASTNQSQILDRWNAQNIAAGLKPAKPQYYDDTGIMRLALLSGRVDVSFDPNSTSAWAARDGKTRKVGSFSGGWPLAAQVAVATRKGSGLAEPITAALNAQIANGTYARLLKRWGLEAEAIDRSQTNPPGLPKS